MTLPIKYIIYAVLFVFFQVLVCKNIVFGSELGAYFDVIIYPLLLINLPVNTPAALVVIIAFMSGLSIDFFYDSPGVHTSALVLTGFIRKAVLNTLEPRIGYNVGDTPLSVSRSDYWYYIFSAIILFIHLLVYYLVSYFSFAFIGEILLKTIMTFFVSMLLVSLHGIVWRALN